MQVREREDKGKLFRPWAPRCLQTTVGQLQFRDDAVVAAATEDKGLDPMAGYPYLDGTASAASCGDAISSTVCTTSASRSSRLFERTSLASSHLVLPMGPLHESTSSTFSVKDRRDHLGPSGLRPPVQLPCLQTPKTYCHSSLLDGRHHHYNHCHRSHQFTTHDMDDGKLKKQRPKRFPCPHCQVAFSNNGQLKGHVRIHTGERPFKCDNAECGKTFTRNEELTRHKRIHSGLRPYACHVCSKKFGRKDHLKKHVKTHQQKTTTTVLSNSVQQHPPTLMMMPYVGASTGSDALMAALQQSLNPTSSATILHQGRLNVIAPSAGSHHHPECPLIFW